MTHDAPLGSRWYAHGHHWEVVKEQLVDGEPGAIVRCLTGHRKRIDLPMITRLLVKNGTRVDEREENDQ